jgi:AcrR family transcriptional regulator
LGRVHGARDADFSEKRSALVARVRERLAQSRGDHPSFRQLAEFADVSQATLRHYFGDLTALITAVFEAHAAEGTPYLARLSQPSGDFQQSISDAVAFVANGQRQQPVRAIHRIGNAEGVRRGVVGTAYRAAVLDPVFRALQDRLDAHVHRGDMRPCDTQAAAIVLCAPVLLLFQHQVDLGGAMSEPIDVSAFLKEHVDGFIRGYRA